MIAIASKDCVGVVRRRKAGNDRLERNASRSGKAGRGFQPFGAQDRLHRRRPNRGVGYRHGKLEKDFALPGIGIHGASTFPMKNSCWATSSF